MYNWFYHLPNWFNPVAGGVLIGLAATLMLVLFGRIMGVSGIVGTLTDSFKSSSGNGWRWSFIAGLIGGGALFNELLNSLIKSANKASVHVLPNQLMPTPFADLPLGMFIVAGLLVGYGTAMGAGCTSGHGICGLARGSKRSIAATLMFMSTGMLVATLVHHA